MKISSLDKFIKGKKLYHFLYGFLSTLILVIIIIYLVINKHQVIYTYDGVTKDNLVEITNLKELDLLNITNSKSIIINNKKIKCNYSD